MVPDQIALRRHRRRKISIRCTLAIMVGASILFFFGTSDIRSLTQVAPAAAKSRKAAPQDPGQAPTQPAPYDHDLQRLSEILGALHFLRGICNSNEGPKWRNEAQALIDAERHDDMVASFNRGYLSFQSYRTCTSVADVVIRHYLERSLATSPHVTRTNAESTRPLFIGANRCF